MWPSASPHTDLIAPRGPLVYGWIVNDEDLGEAPTVLEEGDAVTVYLGSREGKSWFLVLDDRGAANEPVTAGTREDLLFLAGECAGLLFFRELAEAGEELDLE